MIDINLLPPEHRPVERTPLPRMLTILAGVLLTAGGVVAWLGLTVVAIPNASRACEDKRAAMLQAQALADEVKKIDDELKAAKDREGVLRELFDNRIGWARLLDRLAEVRNKLKAGEDVVLTSVDLRKKAGSGRGRGKSAEVRQLYLKGFVASDRQDAMAGELRETCFGFIQLLCSDKEFKQAFDCDEKEKGDGNAKYLYLGDQMVEIAGSSGGKGKAAQDAGPKAALVFEVIFDFKAPPAPVQKQAPKSKSKSATRPASGGAH